MLAFGVVCLKLHEKLQRSIERVFFRGKTTKWSMYLTYVVGNIILMLLLFYVLLNNVAYDWTGQLYPVGSGFRLDTVFGGLDGAVPFVPEMVIFYVYLFYPLVILTMLYFAFVEYKRGYALGWSLVAINGIAVLVYIMFPVSTYWWRQDLLAHRITDNFWANQVYSVYASDTSFNCFPSLHAAVSAVCFYAWYRYSQIKASIVTRGVTIMVFAVAAGVILSILFIKQHYIADEIAGVVLAWAVGKLVFNYSWKNLN